jgi:hypothetical protein
MVVGGALAVVDFEKVPVVEIFPTPVNSQPSFFLSGWKELFRSAIGH